MSLINKWTDHEKIQWHLDNLLNKGENSCANCRWGGACKTINSGFVRCEQHYQNFSIDSYCDYWTDPDDDELLEKQLKRKDDLIGEINCFEN